MMSREVIGHDQVKCDLAVAAYTHFMMCAKAEAHGGQVRTRQNTLLVGPTGCGKSYLLKTLAKVLRVPLIYISCAEIAPCGYKGRDMSEWVKSISNRIFDEDDVRTQPTVVIWDEIDKLRDDGSLQGSYKSTVQKEMLTYLDGCLCGIDNELDSSQIFNLACGAFVGLDEIRQPESNKPVIGFQQPYAQSHSKDRMQPLLPLVPEHLVRYGFTPEFVGRFSNLASLEAPDHATMRRILCEAENNPLAEKKQLFAIHSIRLELTDDAIDEVIDMAVAHATGARSLRLILDKLFKQTEFHLPEMAARGVSSVVYDCDAVTGKSPPAERTECGARPLETLQQIREKAGSYANWKKPQTDSDILSIW